MVTKNPPGVRNERILYHGTQPENCCSIQEIGFKSTCRKGRCECGVIQTKARERPGPLPHSPPSKSASPTVLGPDLNPAPTEGETCMSHSLPSEPASSLSWGLDWNQCLHKLEKPCFPFHTSLNQPLLMLDGNSCPLKWKGPLFLSRCLYIDCPCSLLSSSQLDSMDRVYILVWMPPYLFSMPNLIPLGTDSCSRHEC